MRVEHYSKDYLLGFDETAHQSLPLEMLARTQTHGVKLELAKKEKVV